MIVSCGKSGGGDQNTDDKNDKTEQNEDSEYMKGHNEVLTYELDEDSSRNDYVLESGDVNAYQKMGLEVDKKTTYDGANASGKWANQVSKTNITLKAE